MNIETDSSNFSGFSDSTTFSENKLAELYFSSPHFSHKSCDSKNDTQAETLTFLIEKNKRNIARSNKFSVSFLFNIIYPMEKSNLISYKKTCRYQSVSVLYRKNVF
jgi:hypothetical protein